MDIHLANDAVSTLDSHRHDWRPIDGWSARYRCRDCGAVGYKPRVVTIGVEGGPYGSTRITPYVCSVKHAGLRCGCPALKKTRGAWRCGAHLETSPVSHTSAARALAMTAPSNDPSRTPLRASGDHPVERSTVGP